MKTEYTFTTSEGKTSHLILSDSNLNDEADHFIQKCISPELQAAKRKLYRKVVGLITDVIIRKKNRIPKRNLRLSLNPR
ncbi:hypothetical protein ACFO3D_04525 [Virgibacillus kekensis]|uniref:Uncharacterized protein n=1 Tax=Virgibacillus kekensis TaxID=202261 RepID=A0ABV9DFK3_9BACI